MMDEVQRRKPWLTHKEPEKWAAILMSDNTRNFYGRSAGQVEERYMANVLGTFRAAVEEHLQVAVINDWNLNEDDLSKYKVLVLPNAACLDEKQTEAIDRFVKNGGGLVASLDTSLFDEYGSPRDNFSLARVLGVDYRGLPEAKPMAGAEEIDVNFAKSIGPDYWEKRKSVFDFRQDVNSFLNQGKMKTYNGADPVTFKGPAVRVAIKDADVMTVATMTDKFTAGATALPSVVSRQYGKGKVVYFASGLDAGYYLYSYPYQRLAMVHAIRWAAAAPQSVAVNAPMCVHSTVMRQNKDGISRIVVHLFSDLNTTADHALPVDDVPLREEVVPIHDIRVTFGPQYKIRHVHQQPDGTELTLVTANGSQSVVVPKLDVHTMVVAELEESP